MADLNEKASMEEKVKQVKRICRRRCYVQYFLEILRGLGPEEWMLGDTVCDTFGQMCTTGIPDTKGGWCKGFNHNLFRRELLGNGDGLLIQCDAPLDDPKFNSKEWYKTRNFRINPYYYEAVNAYLD